MKSFSLLSLFFASVTTRILIIKSKLNFANHFMKTTVAHFQNVAKHVLLIYITLIQRGFFDQKWWTVTNDGASKFFSKNFKLFHWISIEHEESELPSVMKFLSRWNLIYHGQLVKQRIPHWVLLISFNWFHQSVTLRWFSVINDKCKR